MNSDRKTMNENNQSIVTGEQPVSETDNTQVQDEATNLHTVSISKPILDALMEGKKLEAKEINAEIEKSQWWWVANNTMLFDSVSGILWQAEPSKIHYPIEETKTYLEQLSISGIGNWQMPSWQELQKLMEEKTFPLQQDPNAKKLLKSWYWHIDTGEVVDVEYITNASPKITGDDGRILPRFHKAMDNIAFFNFCNKHHFSIRPENSDVENKVNDYLSYLAYQQGKLEFDNVQGLFTDIDYISTRLPKIDNLFLTDINQGLWEFYSTDKKPSHYINIKTRENIRSRNPVKDIQPANVAIDFGTSSTVVAIRRDGQDELLRIGMQAKDYLTNDIKTEHFENPTVIELIDYPTFLKAWQAETHRPLVNWDTVHSAHEARASFRNNNSDPLIVGSILQRLKQWAMYDEYSENTFVTDQQGHEHAIEHLKRNDPSAENELIVNKNYPFDPIELYAWYLGMYINWRSRGIFLNYFMTFPVKFKKQVKENILSSFRRGLQRSLPYTLVQDPAFFQAFSVVEQASEPAAFSAAAFTKLDIEPTEEGVPYSVFDFGGGTTDFDYGIYRLPIENNDDEGDYDAVIEHFGASGDEFLGGELILENLAYLVFQQNIEACRQHEIAFTKPADAKAFAGSEMLLLKTQATITNTTLMMTKLRNLWEKGSLNTDAEGTETIKLINRHGKTVDVDIVIKQTDLISYIESRIFDGLKSFFIEMKSAFIRHSEDNQVPLNIHLFLAGNSSRSLILQEFLGVSQNNITNYNPADFGTNNATEGANLADMELDSVNPEYMNAEQAVEGEEQAPTYAPVNNNPNTVNLSNIERANARHARLQEFLDTAVFAPEERPEINIHLPFDSENLDDQITAKTGVAMGLLDLCPGEAIKVINLATEENDGESPFQYFVGTHKLKKFKPCMVKSQPFHEWVELGAIRKGQLFVVYTKSAEARTGQLRRGDSRLKEILLSFSGDTTNCRAFVRVVETDKIEVCSAQSLNEVQADNFSNLQLIHLTV